VRRGIIKDNDFPLNKGCSVAGMWMQHLGLCLVSSPSGFFGGGLCWNNKGYWCL